MKKQTRLAITVLVAGVLAVAAVGVGAAVASGGSDEDATDTAITGDALDQASRVAIDHLGGGTVTGTEIEDEDSYYEVEVTLDGGSQIDVQLDEQFNVVGDELETTPDDD